MLSILMVSVLPEKPLMGPPVMMILSPLCRPSTFLVAFLATKKVLGLETGDNVIMTGGPINGQTGNTNTIKIEAVE